MITQWSDKQIQGIRSDRGPEELWTEDCNIKQEALNQTIAKKKQHKSFHPLPLPQSPKKTVLYICVSSNEVDETGADYTE